MQQLRAGLLQGRRQSVDDLTARLSRGTDMELERSGPIERIPNFQIDSWKYVDHYHIVIETHREQYLIALQNYCSGINGAIEIGYTSRTGALTRFEKILVHQGFGQPEECYIEDIVKLNAVSTE